MAPGLKRAAAYTPLACALLAAALLPPKEPEDRQPRPAPRTDIRARRQLEAAGSRLALLILRDSVLARASLPGTFTRDSLAFLVQRGLPAKVDLVFRTTVSDLWGRAVGGIPHVRGVAVIEVDTVDAALTPRAWTRVDHILPDAADGRTCISRMSVGVRDARLMHELGRLPGDLLARIRAELPGVCSFYAAFGIPGTGIREWLEVQQYVPAIRSNRVLAPLWFDEGTPQWLHFGFVECASGRLESCRQMLKTRPGDDRRPVRFAEFDIPGVVAGDSHIDWRGPLGPWGSSYLNDMLAHFGRERFARFWTSDAPLEQAFHDAMGEPIEQWTMRWAQADVGAPAVGPAAPAGPAVLSVVASLVVVVAAGALSRLRQVA